MMCELKTNPGQFLVRCFKADTTSVNIKNTAQLAQGNTSDKTYLIKGKLLTENQMLQVPNRVLHT